MGIRRFFGGERILFVQTGRRPINRRRINRAYRSLQGGERREERGILLHPLKRASGQLCRLLQELSFMRPPQGLHRVSVIQMLKP